MKDLKDNLPLLSALLLIIGAAKIFYFYSYFGVDIFSYIEITEIFTLSLSFFANALLFIIPFAILILQQALTLETRVPKIWSRALLFRTEQRSDIDKITPLEATVGIIFWIGLLLSMISMLTGYLAFTVTFDMAIGFILILILPFVSSHLLPSIQLTINKIFKIDITNGFIAFLLIVIFSGLYAIGYSRQTARNIELKENFVVVEIKFDSLTIKSSESYRYIGKTKGYAFFYDKISRRADAYLIGNAKSLSVTNEVFFDGVMMSKSKE